MFKKTDEQLVEAFYKLRTREDVADILEIADKSLRFFLYSKKFVWYRFFELHQKNGKVRLIHAPVTELKIIQKKLQYVFELIYNPKICAYGFIKNKNITQNALNHVKQKILLNIDLKDFFHHIHFGRIRGMLKAKPYSIGEDAATVIAQLACFNGYLPQGAPTSPILSNMICVPLDNELIRFAKKQRMVYTRYVDDISFSTSNIKFETKIVDVIGKEINLGDELTDIIKKHGFIINEEKLHLKRYTERQEVTGIIVNEKLNVKREYVKRVRSILYHCQKEGIYKTALRYIELGLCNNATITHEVKSADKEDYITSWFIKVIKGKIDYIKQIKGENDLTYLSYAKKANEIFKRDLFDVLLLMSVQEIAIKNVFILESKTRQGSGVYIHDIGIITSYHVVDDESPFKVYRVNSEGTKDYLGAIIFNINSSSSNKDIDYALFNISVDDSANLLLGDSKNLKIGDKVTIAGFPNYNDGNTITCEDCEITGSANYMGSELYKVSGRIIHGSSGGAVFNSDKKLIGIIKGGVASLEETDLNDKQGFVPIHLILENINLKYNKRKNTSY